MVSLSSIPGPPGLHRYPTAKQGLILYAIVIILVLIGVCFLARAWNYLDEDYNLESTVDEGLD